MSTHFTPSELDALAAVAHALADAAGPAALRHFRVDGLIADDKIGKPGYDPVTAGDREAEAAMRAILAQMRPNDAILGEEEGATPGTSGLTWVLDPIDGTRSFVSGMPLWAVLVALFDGTRPVLGIIDQPFTGERFFGVCARTGRRATHAHGGEISRLAVRSCADLSQATLFTTFPEVGTAAERAAFETVRDRARLTRYGADCYAYAMLAAGQVDLVVEAGLQPYDVQALIPVVEGAGGMITGWRGEPCHQGGRVLAAGDPALHTQALALLRDVPDQDAN